MSDREALARFLMGFTGKGHALCREAADVIAEAYFHEPPADVPDVSVRTQESAP